MSKQHRNIVCGVTFAKTRRLIGAVCYMSGQAMHRVIIQPSNFALHREGVEESLLEYRQSAQYIFRTLRMTCEGNIR
jgi:hypothetical protein